jgi:error-prone DNA polymerase
VRRAQVARQQLESLATAGALAGVGSGDRDRRSQLWAAGPIAHATLDRLPGLVVGDDAPPLPELSALDEAEADLWATGLTVGPTAVELARPKLRALGVIPAAQLLDLPDEHDPSGREIGPRVLVAGVVTHRQRPESAGGAVFLNLEDETGLVNVICSRGAWVRWRQVARSSPALLVRGRLERLDGSVSVTAETFTRLDLGELDLPPSRDFR